MFTFLGLSLTGFIAAVLSGLAGSSTRRFIVAGCLGLIVTYVAFPFATSFGFLSRQAIGPTLLAMTPVFPAFLLIPIVAGLGLWAARRGSRLVATLGLIAGAVSLLLALIWFTKNPSLIVLRPLYGLMEAVTGLGLVGLITLIGWNNKHLRLPVFVIGLVAGIGFFFWLNSPVGHQLFPNAEGYYKLTTSVAEGTEESIVDQYNAGLDEQNEQRRRIGLKPYEAIESITGLEGQKIPREAADTGFRLLTPKESDYGTSLYFLLAGLLIGGGLMQLWRPHLEAKTDLYAGAIIAGILALLTPAFSATGFSFGRFIEGMPFLLDFLDRAWPPLLSNPDAGEFGVFPLQEVMSQMLITIEIALVGTFLAAIFAIPLSFFAARNLTQGNGFMRAVFFLTRGFFNLDRGVDTLILALIFVAAVGLGPFAGVLAMAIHSIADLGKVYSESIENVNSGPIEALESVGASGTNVVRWAILPQVMPLFVGWTLYRFEINFRVSIVLGLVGAGGIGFFISDKMKVGQYDQMIIAIIAIIVVVNIIDFASSWLRERLV